MTKPDKKLSSTQLQQLKLHCYQLSSAYTTCCILDSCGLSEDNGFEFIAGFGSEVVSTHLQHFINRDISKWWLGVMSYDLKNNFERLSSNNTSTIDFPELFMFVPKLLITVSTNLEVEIIGDWDSRSPIVEEIPPELNSKDPGITKENYLQTIARIQDLIRQGEVYEINFCNNHSIGFEKFDHLSHHKQLIADNPVPMATYLKTPDFVLSGASMERFMRRQGNKIISQPIKGTAPRSQEQSVDAQHIADLKSSDKERAENVMIVDLVRNDLSRVCEPGSVKVDELFGIYTYPTVHQMISTVSGTLKKDKTFDDILKVMFPMGSMTGAPKIAAMKIIEELEQFKRGWYSGATGYIAPNGNFDFSVVIRSLMVDLNNKVLSYAAGGAITIDSEAEKEWKEMRLKTAAIEKALDRI